jgi:hypothetical protein
MTNVTAVSGPPNELVALTRPIDLGWLTGFLSWSVDHAADGWGVADAIGHRFVQLGPLRGGAFEARFWTTPAIGYARRVGTTYTNRADALQPIVMPCTASCAGFALVHIGAVPNAVAWCRAEALTWLGQCDSEVIARSLSKHQQHRASWPERLAALHAKLIAPYALAVATGREVWVMRAAAPLYANRRLGAASTRPLPGGELMGEGQPERLAWDGRDYAVARR